MNQTGHGIQDTIFCQIPQLALHWTNTKKSSHNSHESKFISQSLMAAALVKAYPSILRRCVGQTAIANEEKTMFKQTLLEP